jgi:two-component system LytT family response regulator
MIRIIIVEDEPVIQEAIAKTVSQYCPNVEIVARAGTVRAGVAAINEFQPDVVLLDIRLPDGSGFDLVRHFDRPDFKVIILSGYMEYAIKAFKINAIDYLLKPFDGEELALAVNKAAEWVSRDEMLKMRSMEDNLKALQKDQVIILKTSEQIHAVHASTIIRIEADGSYSTFYVSDGRRILVSRPINVYEDQLAGQGFYRIHKSHIINIKHLRYFDKADGGQVIMSDNAKVSVASRKRDMLMELFENLP